MLQIPSDKVPFNQAPDMKAYEITEAGKEALRSGKYKMVSTGCSSKKCSCTVCLQLVIITALSRCSSSQCKRAVDQYTQQCER
jgi:DNA-binding PadR family transcriptional regulator